MGKIIQILITLIFFILGLGYVLAPAPDNIEDIPGLPNSFKSDEPGDTYQNPNIAAYYSDHWREYVTRYYKSEFEKLNNFGIKLPAIGLNHPPEEAFQFVKDQAKTTFLEQYIFPLRGSLFVNGYEPISRNGKRFNAESVPIEVNNIIYNSKTTLRFYPVPLHIRIIFYFLIWIVITAIYLLSKRIWMELKK